MTYVVLARKWRPQTFEEVVGQSHVTQTLTNAIALGRVHHAFLFTGARGVGKTSIARILAKALNCETGPTGTPCNSCASCTEVAAGTAIDVFEIDGASNRGINEIRELRDSVRYRPSRDRYKVYIIDEVHMLTTEAFNALLKTLEEPPSHVVFIFATTEPQRVPVTIQSRCQRYDFKRVSLVDVGAQLRRILQSEQVAIDDDALTMIARESEGSMRDALSLLDQVIAFAGEHISGQAVAEILGVSDQASVYGLLEALIERDVTRALSLFAEIHHFGIAVKETANQLLGAVRNLLVVKSCEDSLPLTDLTPSEWELYRALAARCETLRLERIFNEILSAANELARTPFAKMLFELALIRGCRMAPAHTVQELLAKLAEMETRMTGNTSPSEATPSRSLPSSAPAVQARPQQIAAAPPQAGPQSPRTEPAAPATPPTGGSKSLPSANSSPATAEPAPGEKSDPAGEGVEFHWRGFVERCVRRSPIYGNMLRDAQFRGLSADQLRLAFRQRALFDNATAARELVESELKAMFGRPVRVVVVDDLDPGKKSISEEQRHGLEAEIAKTKSQISAHPAMRSVKEVFPDSELVAITVAREEEL